MIIELNKHGLMVLLSCTSARTMFNVLYIMHNVAHQISEVLHQIQAYIAYYQK